MLNFAAIKNVLKQGNLNPEIEEKLLTLQRYQEKQMKGEPFDTTSFSSSYTARGAGGSGENDRGCQSPVDDDFDEDSMDSDTRPSRRRGAGAEDDDDEWVLDTPRKYVKKADRDRSEGKKGKEKDYMGEFKKTIAQDKMDAMTSGSLGKVIVKTTEPGKFDHQIKKNIIIYNKPEVQSATPNSFTVISGGVEHGKVDKVQLAKQIKMKMGRENRVSIGSDDHTKQAKLHVS